MSNSIEIDRDDLLNDPRLIILQELIKHYDEDDANVDGMRYSSVKNWSNQSLAELTEGRRTDFGGNFENLIQKLEGKDDPNEKFLVRIRKGTKKTYIIPQVQKIRDHLQRKRMNAFLPPHEQDYQVSQKLVKEVLKAKFLKRMKKFHQDALALHEKAKALGREYPANDIISNDYEFLREAAAEYHATMQAEVWRLYLSTSSTELKNRKITAEVDEQGIERALDFGNYLVSKNPQRPFKVIIEYKGISTNPANQSASQMFYQGEEKIAEYFVKWAERYHDKEVSLLNEHLIREGNTNQLPDDLRELWAKFYALVTGVYQSALLRSTANNK